ncbi:MAG: 7-cyano-7-deazaguanine synthase QueC [Candidatus Thermoplasmatota archaeon]|nr:7-cyano-7-deazaguanine synthase QueC [Candidatus Thermoplasmatota archaeon]
MGKKAVCLISGGIDSAVSTFIVKDKGYEIYALSFDYGQHHSKELSCAEHIAKAADAQRHIIFPLELHRFGGSALVDDLSPIENHDINDIGRTIPSTYVPARNTVFLSIGLAHAETLDADAVVIGATAADYAGYPDCRPEYIQAYQQMADLATKRGVEGRSVTIDAPVLALSKAEIIRTGLKLNVPFASTWSCYRGQQQACGTCDSCLLRLKGFKEANAKDPIQYAALPDWY